MTTTATSQRSRREYMARINRVIDFIEEHIAQPLDLQTIAGVANFSPFHFHRIFSFVMGETPNDFIQRLRLEKAAFILLRDKDVTVTEIAYACGFSSISLFSRTFSRYFGVSPSRFARTEKGVYLKDGEYFSKNGQPLSKNVQKCLDLNAEFCSVERLNLVIMDAKIEIMQLPDMKAVYCRHMGAFHEIHRAYEKVIKWAVPRGLYDPAVTKTATVVHDDPTITGQDKVRQSACVIVNEDVKVEGEIGKMTIAGGKYVVGHFEIGMDGFQNAWNTMCHWFTESGYQQGDGYTFELYHNFYQLHPEKKHIVDICIPVKPL